MASGVDDLTPEERESYNRELKILFVLIGFLALCYFTGAIMKVAVTDEYKQTLPSKGGLYGPFNIEEDNTSVMITINHTQRLKSFQWDALDVEILDENKAYMSIFGAEFWAESGRDSDGKWSESVYEAKFAYYFHNKGDYYLKVETSHSKNNSKDRDALFVITVRQQLGSGELFFAVGFWMLWIVVAWFCWTFRRFEGDE